MKVKNMFFFKKYLNVFNKIKFYGFLSIICTNFIEARPLEFTCPFKSPSTNSIDSTKSIQDQISQIDKEIQRLRWEKEKFLGKAARFQDLGDRLQFHQHYVQEAKRYWDLADCALDVVDEINENIKILEKEKNRLKNSNPFQK